MKKVKICVFYKGSKKITEDRGCVGIKKKKGDKRRTRN